MTAFDLGRFRSLPENEGLTPLEFLDQIRKAAALFQGASRAIELLSDNNAIEEECGYCDECEACEAHYAEIVHALIDKDQKVLYELLAHARIESIVHESGAEKETKS